MIIYGEPDLSVVIPLYNEEESIPELYRALTDVLDGTVLEGQNVRYEIIVVDDGSTDQSFARLRELALNDDRFKVIQLRRNFGQTAAFAAGFDYAKGDIVITMDADLQNDPADIPKLLVKMNEGYDIVSGWRKDRKDRFLDRRLPSIIANSLISNITDVRLHDYGCSLKAYRRDVLKEVHLYGEMHRFIPALASQVGGSLAEVPVNHRARQYGTSKYGIGRTIRVVLDLVTVWFFGSYATRPLHVFGTLGLGSFGLGFLLGLYLTLVKFVFGDDIGGRPLLVLAVLLVVVGVQLITMGLLGEMIIRTYHESQSKPIYVVREVLSARNAANQADVETTVQHRGKRNNSLNQMTTAKAPPSHA
ncbi:glycosyltransferase family 2 protein [Chloroflexi bacterium TSY]|nr:glycosyltransferase family 2 protein [Chloroflexi bacterium TSY]